MRKIQIALTLALAVSIFAFSSFNLRPNRTSFNPQRPAIAIRNYVWYTPDGEFVAYSTLVNTLYVTGGDLDSVNGTLVALGYTGGGPDEPPSGELVYKVYTHP